MTLKLDASIYPVRLKPLGFFLLIVENPRVWASFMSNCEPFAETHLFFFRKCRDTFVGTCEVKSLKTMSIACSPQHFCHSSLFFFLFFSLPFLSSAVLAAGVWFALQMDLATTRSSRSFIPHPSGLWASWAHYTKPNRPPRYTVYSS